MSLISKSLAVSGSDLAPGQMEVFVESSLKRMLKNLGVDFLPVFLFHREADLVWMEALWRVKDQEFVGQIGVSVETSGGALRVAEHPLARAVQLPYNLLDRRFSSGSILQQLQQRETVVFARSVFLQGLLLMPEAHPRRVASGGSRAKAVRGSIRRGRDGNDKTVPALQPERPRNHQRVDRNRFRRPALRQCGVDAVGGPQTFPRPKSIPRHPRFSGTNP